MNRPELVHVITLVGPRTGIHKRKHTGYQQGGLMMRNRVRTGKKRTSLTVFALAITEKQGL